MNYYDSAFYGMHFWWWVFWGALWMSVLMFWSPVPRYRLKEMKDTPTDILKRRLAKGEIDEAKYLSLKAQVENEGSRGTPLTVRRAV